MTKRERQVTDREEILKILDKCKILHLGLVDGDEPYVVPMNYGYVMEGEQLTLYMHGATKGYKLDLMRKNPKVFFEMECDVQGFEGEIACQYGTVYQSIMGRGKATIIEEPQEKIETMKLFMKSQTGRDFEFSEKMVSAVVMIRIDVSEYTAKRRPMPGTYV
ncbi:MAG: pyridoxamine 5'-phosphate oxidase family protein [Firmicutes bacterium]|nr:pyridoxamine 5'-phosphate oxidase family protein [Bacillota bacterium]MBQ6949698.1 pyridoxamine 5'-phosphate oxidase family protein [Bacillota bacterium]